MDENLLIAFDYPISTSLESILSKHPSDNNLTMTTKDIFTTALWRQMSDQLLIQMIISYHCYVVDKIDVSDVKILSKHELYRLVDPTFTLPPDQEKYTDPLLTEILIKLNTYTNQDLSIKQKEIETWLELNLSKFQVKTIQRKYVELGAISWTKSAEPFEDHNLFKLITMKRLLKNCDEDTLENTLEQLHSILETVHKTKSFGQSLLHPQ